MRFAPGCCHCGCSVVADDFTRSELGEIWSVDSGTWAIVGNRLQLTGSGKLDHVARTTSGDYRISAKIEVNEIGQTFSIYFGAGYRIDFVIGNVSTSTNGQIHFFDPLGTLLGANTAGVGLQLNGTYSTTISVCVAEQMGESIVSTHTSYGSAYFVLASTPHGSIGLGGAGLSEPLWFDDFNVERINTEDCDCCGYTAANNSCGDCKQAANCLEVEIAGVHSVGQCTGCPDLNGTWRVTNRPAYGIPTGYWWGYVGSEWICGQCGLSTSYSMLLLWFSGQTLTARLGNEIEWKNTTTQTLCQDWNAVPLTWTTDSPSGTRPEWVKCSGEGSTLTVTALPYSSDCSQTEPDDNPCYCPEILPDNEGPQLLVSISGVVNDWCTDCGEINQTVRAECLHCDWGSSSEWNSGLILPEGRCLAQFPLAGDCCGFDGAIWVFQSPTDSNWYVVLRFGQIYTGDPETGTWAEFVKALGSTQPTAAALSGITLDFAAQTITNLPWVKRQCDFSSATVTLSL